MGNAQPKLSTQERTARNETRTAAIQQVQQRVEEFQRQAEATASSSTTPTSLVLFGSTQVPVSSVQAAVKIATIQLQREGKEFTKPDLIAMVVALQPSMQAKIGELSNFRCEDLRAYIRTIIYDPSAAVPPTYTEK